MDITPITKTFVKFRVTVTDVDTEQPVVITALDVGLTPQFATPVATTAWTAASPVGDRWRTLIAGPQADPVEALAVAVDGADLWGRVTDNPEILPFFIGRINVK